MLFLFMAKKKILVAPLNWGLGHATRCIPIINALQESGFEPILASDGGCFTAFKKGIPYFKNLRITFLQNKLCKKGIFLQI